MAAKKESKEIVPMPNMAVPLPDGKMFVFRDPTVNGAPKTVKPEGMQFIENMKRNAWTEGAIALALGVDPGRTFRRMKKDQPEIESAIMRGHVGLESEITNLILERCRRGCLTSLLFVAKCKLFWSEYGQRKEQEPAKLAVHINLPSPLAVDAYRRKVIDVSAETIIEPPIESVMEQSEKEELLALLGPTDSEEN